MLHQRCFAVCVVVQWKEAKLLQITAQQWSLCLLLCIKTSYILVVMSCSQIDISDFDAVCFGRVRQSIAQQERDSCERGPSDILKNEHHMSLESSC